MKRNEALLADDLLHGAAAIGKFLGMTERQVWHHVDHGNLPVKKMGRLLVGSKSRLRAHFAETGETSSA